MQTRSTTGNGRETDRIGEIFRTARESQRLSQQQVAALTRIAARQVSRTTISSIERGRMPRLDALTSLSRVLHLDPAQLIERVEIAEPLPEELDGMSRRGLYERAAELLETGDDRGALTILEFLTRGACSGRTDEPDAAGPPPAALEIDRARALRRCRALRSAQAAAQRAVQLSELDSPRHARAFVELSRIYSDQRLPVLARDAAARAVEIAETSSCDEVRGMARRRLGSVLHARGEVEAARRVFLEARKLAIDSGNLRHRVTCELELAVCLRALGDSTHARSRLVTVVRLSRERGLPESEARGLVELGRLDLDRRGGLEQADRFARAALRIARPAKLFAIVFEAEWLRHLVLRRAGTGPADRHRLSWLRRLYPRIENELRSPARAEFAAAVCGSPGAYPSGGATPTGHDTPVPPRPQ